MKYIDEYRDAGLGKKLAGLISRISSKPATLMEFCGGHTVAIMRNGLRQLLPPHIQMLSGPGCPVCVTANSDIDSMLALSRQPDVIITTFGDMIKVPGSYSSLQQARAEGADVRIIYSSQDAIKIAEENPGRPVIFIGIGFETTAPTIAATIHQAKQMNVRNFYVHCLLKLCPPVIKAVLDLGEVKVNGIIGPGHVSTITGTTPYEFIPRDYGIGFVISGFESLDILQSVAMLVEQIEQHRPAVQIAYSRGVKAEGNPRALNLMYKVFNVTAADWRGIGIVPESGLRLSEQFAGFDALAKFDINVEPARETKGCICGEVIRGVANPHKCPLFRKVCTPENPIGPCMVSSEGSCSAYYLYGESDV
jgi:hydrogenase expression/formation protein HypD